MKTLWITYSWEDNKTSDVEFLAQELEKCGIRVKLDRWTLQAGKRLWEQIDKFIADPSLCDGYAIYATQNSLGSEPCKEEVAYALDRALGARGHYFPIIAIAPSTVDKSLLPSSLKTRLFVSLRDTNWMERIKSSLENRPPDIPKQPLAPYDVQIRVDSHGTNAIEFRPRTGTWAPFFCAIPLNEKDKVSPKLSKGPLGTIPYVTVLTATGSFVSNDNLWFVLYAGDEATSSISYYLKHQSLPSKVIFGVLDSQPQFELNL